MGLSTKQPGIIDWDNPQTTSSGSTRLDLPAKPPQKAEALKCPRCASTNTKFCYYNNYNKSQPRHFCKGCKRHWTEGGTLRNVPVGGSRKNKRLKTPAVTADNQKPVFSGEQKNMPGIFFPTIQNDPATTSFNVVPTSLVSHDDRDTKLVPFSFSSSLGYLDPISCFNNQSSYRDIIGEVENVEESTITTVMPFSQLTWQDHQGIMNDSSEADVANYWSLSDIDSLVSADLNIPWDDLEIKPKGK